MSAEKILKYELSKIPGNILRNVSTDKISENILCQYYEDAKFISDVAYAKRVMGFGGFIYKIRIKDRLAGIVAADKRNLKFLSGYYIIEEILFKEFRSQNFGPAVQKNMIDSIRAKNDEFIYGTISALNPASLKTAIHCGRKIAGADYYIKF